MKPFLMTEAKKERYTQQGYWGLPTLLEIFERNASLYPDKEIFVDSTNRVTLSQAKTYTDRLALGLVDLGYRKDNVLVTQLPNTVESPLLRLACPSAGVLAVPVLSAFGVNEIKHILGKTEAKGIAIPWKVGNRDYFEVIREIRPDLPKLEHVFVIGDEVPEGCISVKEMMQRPIEKQYPADGLKDKWIGTWEIQELQTSTGSTGLPKISEGFGWNQLLGYKLKDRWRLTESDNIGLPIPFAGGVSNNAWTTSIVGPCKLALLEKFNPTDGLKFIEREKISILVGVPTIGEMLVRAEDLNQYDLSSLRIFFWAGAPMPLSLANEIEGKLGCSVIGLLGSMDFGPITVASLDDSPHARRTSVGKALPGNELRIVDENGEDVPPGGEGELMCRGPYSYTGYYKMPDATLDAYGGDKDGWFRTGDLGRIDSEGYLYIVGRLRDVIKRGAMTIAPVEIEDLLRTHPKIAEVSAVGMPDPILGEKVCAFVVPQRGQALSFEEMVSYLQEKKLATFKMPERLEIVDEFPTVGGQKIYKKALVDIVTQKLKDEGKF